MKSSLKPVILIVDDEVMLRMLASDYFEDAGYEVIEASNGAQALATLDSRPDILAIFTDVRMPGNPDGIAVANQVHEQHPDMAIIVVSSHRSQVADDLSPGIRFVTKPYVGSAVVGMFDDMLRESGAGPRGPQ